MRAESVRMLLALVLCLLAGLPAVADGPPPELRPAFAELNRGRAALGLPPFAWDDRLYRAEMELCRHNWDEYQAGTGCPTEDGHWDVLGRMRRAGWPLNGISPPDARLRGTNESECGTSGEVGNRPDHCGWSYPEHDPAGWVKVTVDWFLEQSRDGQVGPHCADFRAGYNRAAIGHWRGMTAIAYGYLP